MRRYQATDWPPVDARCGVSLRKEIPRAGRRAREHANILVAPRRGGTLGPKAIPRVVGGLDGVGEPLDLLNSNFVAPSVRTQTCVAVSHPEMLALVGTGTSALAFPGMPNVERHMPSGFDAALSTPAVSDGTSSMALAPAYRPPNPSPLETRRRPLDSKK
jgi:hypothetical protein